ncbi:MAG: hypothetical protein ACLPVI_09265 [Dehalococcoidales bacterium]
MVETILLYLWKATLTSLIQIGIFFVPGLFLTLVTNYASTLLQRRALSIIGKGWYLGLFGWLGTIIHELSHALFCLIFFHKITNLKLFDPDQETGTLGYVQHTYDSSNIYQLAGNFFIGIGPILLGTALIYFLLYLLLGLNPFKFAVSVSLPTAHVYSWDILSRILQTIWTSFRQLFSVIFSRQYLSTWQLYLFVYLTFTIGSSITLSASDIKSTLKGLSVILILIFIFNLGTVWIGDLTANIFVYTLSYFLIFYIALLLILFMDILILILFLLPLSILTHKFNG